MPALLSRPALLSLAEQGAQGYAGQGAYVAGQVRLVGVPGPGGDGGERDPGVGQRNGAVQPQDAGQRLRPVAERVQAAPVQAALTQRHQLGGLRDRVAGGERRDDRPDARVPGARQFQDGLLQP